MLFARAGTISSVPKILAKTDAQTAEIGRIIQTHAGPSQKICRCIHPLVTSIPEVTLSCLVCHGAWDSIHITLRRSNLRKTSD